MDVAKRRGQNGKCWFDAQGESSSTRPVLDDRRSILDEDGVDVGSYLTELIVDEWEK